MSSMVQGWSRKRGHSHLGRTKYSQVKIHLWRHSFTRTTKNVLFYTHDVGIKKFLLTSPKKTVKLEFVSIWTRKWTKSFPSISDSSRVFSADHEGNTEEENNGNVVCELNMRGGVTPTAPTIFYSGLLDRYFKTTWTVFSPPRIFSSWPLTFENTFISQRVCTSLEEEEKKGRRRLVVGERNPIIFILLCLCISWWNMGMGGCWRGSILAWICDSKKRKI